jgi:hypothetical protein
MPDESLYELSLKKKILIPIYRYLFPGSDSRLNKFVWGGRQAQGGTSLAVLAKSLKNNFL